MTTEINVHARIFGGISEAFRKAVGWRAKAKEKLRLQNLVKACTSAMNGFLKTFMDLNPDKEPDEIKLTVKVID